MINPALVYCFFNTFSTCCPFALFTLFLKTVDNFVFDFFLFFSPLAILKFLQDIRVVNGFINISTTLITIIF